jgi:short-subunit dehydrogenase
VTGASSGIGREIARQAAARGADVVAVARREDELRTLAREVRDTWGRTVEVLPADLLTAGGLAAVEARLADPDRPVDLLVNNAGFGSLGWFHELPIDREDRQIRLNVLAVTRLASAALAAMVPRGRGGVLNVSSVSGFQPMPTNAVYGASKAFVTSLSQALHGEVRGAGVHVTALCPGFTRTEFQAVAGSDVRSLPPWVWMTSAAVARAGLDAVTRNRAVCVPGVGYRAVATVVDLAPRGVVRRVTALATRASLPAPEAGRR